MTIDRIRGFGRAALMLALGAVGACGRGAPDASARAAATPARAAPAGGAVDSVFPMPVMLDRFRRDVPEPAALAGGALSRDALVSKYVQALERSDTLAFEKLGVSMGEFSWLYYPSATEAQPPYELSPGLAWFRLQEGNRKGVFRALRELGGRKLDFRGYTCSAEPMVQGANRLWTQCRLTIAREPGDPMEVRLFSTILERGGRFAFLSYANDF